MPNTGSNRLDKNAGEIAALGDQLRSLREAQGLSYEDVEKATHVRPHILKAIENGHIEDLPAAVYARGFVKTYCEYLCADDLWRKYNQFIIRSGVASPDVKNEQSPVVRISPPTPIFRRSSMFWVYIVLIFAVLAAAFLLWNQHTDPDGETSGFFLRIQNREPKPLPLSGDTAGESVSVDLQSGVPLGRSMPIVAEIVSGDRSMPPASQGVRGASGDLSWMDGNVRP